MAKEFSKRSWTLVASAIGIVATVCIGVAWFIIQQDGAGTQIPPTPDNATEFHVRYVKFVVENHRSSAVSLAIKVNNSEVFEGSVPPFSPIETIEVLGWVDRLNDSNHSHEFIISMYYDGQEHEQSLIVDPGDVMVEPVTLRCTIA